jgi:hypothetical protein
MANDPMSELAPKITVRLTVKSYDLATKTAIVAFVEEKPQGDPYVDIKPAVGSAAAYLCFPKKAEKKGQVNFVLDAWTLPSGEVVPWEFDALSGKKPRFLRNGVDDTAAFPTRDLASGQPSTVGTKSILKCQYVFPTSGQQRWNLKFSVIGFGTSFTVDPEIENDND